MKRSFMSLAPPILGIALAWSVPAGAQSGGASTAAGVRGAPAAQLRVPDHPVWVGTVRLPVQVMADDKPLDPGRYRVRLTGEHAKNEVIGQTAALERWVEFVQEGRVKGRAMAPVVPAAAAKAVAEASLPMRGTVRVERMKSDAYYRLWFNYEGDQVLVYLPIA